MQILEVASMMIFGRWSQLPASHNVILDAYEDVKGFGALIMVCLKKNPQ